LPAPQKQQVDALLCRLRHVGSVALVHKLEWYRLLYRLRALMRVEPLNPTGLGGLSSSQLFGLYLTTTLPHESPQNIQEQLRKLHQLLRIADQLEDAATETGAAKAFFERLCAPLSPEEVRRVGDSADPGTVAVVDDGAVEESAGQQEQPGLVRKRKRCATAPPQLTLKSFTQVASLLPSILQWCEQNQSDWVASLRVYLYTPTAKARARIRRDIGIRVGSSSRRATQHALQSVREMDSANNIGSTI
jgi:hypothetical protein